MPTRDEQIAGLMRYVRVIAGRLYTAMGAAATRAIALEDLEAEAYVALVRAVDTYDPTRGVPLRGHVGSQVNGHLRHVMRACDPKGRANRAFITRGQKWADEAAQRLGREPTVEEIEAAVPGYRAACARAAQRAHVSLDAVIVASGETLAEVLAADVDVEALVVDHLERADVHGTFWRLVSRLPEMDRAAMTLRYRDALKITEIAAALGLSKSGAEIALSRAHRRLRDLARGTVA